MQDCVTDWQSPAIPPTIRRPWRVFEEDLEEKLTSEASQVGQVANEVREQIAAVQAKGARVAFLSLSESERQTYYQVALHELAAFVFWRRSQLARQKTGEILPTDLEAGWDLLDHTDKGEWLPQDPIAFLSADAQWATLVGDVRGGDERLMGTEELSAVATPMKSEIMPSAPGEKAPLKKEKASPASIAVPAQPLKKEPTTPGAKPADSQHGGPPQQQLVETAAPAVLKAAPATAATIKKELSAHGTALAPEPAKDASSLGAAHQKGGPQQLDRVIVPAPPQKKSTEAAAPKAAPKAPAPQAKPAPEPTRRSRRVNPDVEEKDHTAGSKAPESDKKRKAEGEDARSRKRSAGPATATELSSQGARRHAGKELAPANLFPEALNAKCCKCHQDHASMDNDLAMCDRCDKAYHANCHEPRVAYFGRPDDQWFCASCTAELAEMRELSLKVNDFCWVQCTGETQAWPARVLRIDFCSLADPRPYWVQYFDAGPPEGQWVGEVNVKSWEDGPRWGSIREARRRNAVRLAEAAGSPMLSNLEPAPRTPKRKRPTVAEGDSPRSPEKKQKRPAKEAPAAAKPIRQSRRVQEKLDKKDQEEPPQKPKQPRPTRRAHADKKDPDGEEDEFMQQQASEMRNLIAASRERQRKIEEELAQAARAKQVVLTQAS